MSNYTYVPAAAYGHSHNHNHNSPNPTTLPTQILGKYALRRNTSAQSIVLLYTRPSIDGVAETRKHPSWHITGSGPRAVGGSTAMNVRFPPAKPTPYVPFISRPRRSGVRSLLTADGLTRATLPLPCLALPCPLSWWLPSAPTPPRD